MSDEHMQALVEEHNDIVELKKEIDDLNVEYQEKVKQIQERCTHPTVAVYETPPSVDTDRKYIVCHLCGLRTWYRTTKPSCFQHSYSVESVRAVIDQIEGFKIRLEKVPMPIPLQEL